MSMSLNIEGWLKERRGYYAVKECVYVNAADESDNGMEIKYKFRAQ